MPVTFKRVSADEVQNKRKAQTKSVAGGIAIVKGMTSPRSWNEEARSARFIMTTEQVDRYGDIVGQAGMDLTNFEQNPQGLLFHNSRSWPIGQWSGVTKLLSGRPKRTEGDLNFLPEGVDVDCDRAANHVKHGTMRTVSIGFIPDWDDVDAVLNEEEDWIGFRFNKSELIECSLVPVPANPGALIKDAAGDNVLARSLVEDVLDTWTRTPEGLLVPLKEYEQTHFEMGGRRSSIIVDKDMAATIKAFVPVADLKMKATTQEEAEVFEGADVVLDPAHPENKDWPFDLLAKEKGQVIASYIVEEGINKGVHGLWVEYLTDSYQGMFRGIKAERFLLAKTAESTAKSEADPESDPAADDAEAKAAAAAAEETTDKDVTVTLDVDDAATTAVVEKTNKPTNLSIDVNVDQDGNLKAFVKEVEEAESSLDRLMLKIKNFFGGKDPVEKQRVDPPLADPSPAASPEEIAEARALAAATLQRIAGK